MLREPSKLIYRLPRSEIISLLTSEETYAAHPLYECVKIYVRLKEANTFSYARTKFDLGTNTVSAEDIAKRIDFLYHDEVLVSLTKLEEYIESRWPFLPGSHSWLQLEITSPKIRFKSSENKRRVIIRRAVRLHFLGSSNIETCSNLSKMTSALVSELPAAIGGGFQLTDCKAFDLATIHNESIEDYKTGNMSLDCIISKLLFANGVINEATNPGFYIYAKSVKIRIVSQKYLAKEQKALQQNPIPLPIIGVMK